MCHIGTLPYLHRINVKNKSCRGRNPYNPFNNNLNNSCVSKTFDVSIGQAAVNMGRNSLLPEGIYMITNQKRKKPAFIADDSHTIDYADQI